jgi:uncharacterized membrane protein affecting hemolysin expression
MNRVISRVKYDSMLGITEISQYPQQLHLLRSALHFVLVLMVMLTPVASCGKVTDAEARDALHLQSAQPFL